METDGIPEVQLSGPGSNPIVADPALVAPLTDLNQPGDSMVPLDPEECSSEFLIPRSLVSVSVVPTVVAYTGELVRGLNTQVSICVRVKSVKVWSSQHFFQPRLTKRERIGTVHPCLRIRYLVHGLKGFYQFSSTQSISWCLVYGLYVVKFGQ